MRPIRLTIQAFGPFSHQQSIDFSALGETPFFLINGPTGAGKSAILDAICYAMYGETTGSERAGEQMRCDFSSFDVATVVEFEFELGHSRYRVIRRPEQQVPKKRGQGLTKQSHSASLYQLDADQRGKPITEKTSEVAQELTARIGLNVKQFRQVMVIPQGKFRDLLLANSTDREQILGQLFDTQRYAEIERMLLEKAADIRKAKSEFDQQIKGSLDIAGASDEDELAAMLTASRRLLDRQRDELASERRQLEKLNAMWSAQQTLHQKFSQLEQLRHDEQQLHQQQIQITAYEQSYHNALNADYIAKDFERHHTAKQQLETLLLNQTEKQNELQHAEQQWQESERAYQAMEPLLLSIAGKKESVLRCQEHLARYQRLQELKQSLAVVNRNYSAKQKQLEQEEAALAQKSSELNSMAESLRQRAADKERLSSKQIELQRIIDYLNAFNRLEQLQHKTIHLNQAIATAETMLHQRHTQEHEAQDVAARMEMNWHLNQAAELAMWLKADIPCPVCGSKDHPHPARFVGEVVTKEDVKLAREAYQQAQTARLSAEQQLHELKLDAETVAQQMSDLKQTENYTHSCHLSMAEASESREQIQNEILSIQAIDLDKEQRHFDANETMLREMSDNVAVMKQAVEQEFKQYVAAESEVAAFESQLPPDQNAESVQQTLNILQMEIERIESDAKQKNDRRIAWDKQVAIVKAAITEMKTREVSLNEALTQSELQWQKVLSQSAFASEQAYVDALLPKEKQRELEQTIREFHEKQAIVQAQIQTLDAELSSVPPPDVSAAKLAVEAQKEHLLQSEDTLSKLFAQTERVQKVVDSIDKLKQKNKVLAQQYEVYGTLSDVANGRNAQKVSLHRFVLGVLLDDVLIQASLRLRKMSKGRYNLLRKIEKSKGNAGSGLELLVEDSYTGKSRDVATLSGGESFMAALSLALGLSDVVQSYSGGIRLDTLFIDEGFGSLDTEALDLAIQTLLDLQQHGRTIGIISHVYELKEQMSSRIDVKTTPCGSEISVVGG